MSVYLDASVVVSLFVDDMHTGRADRLIDEVGENAILSPLCMLEFLTTVMRGKRDGRISSRQAKEALEDCDFWRHRATRAHNRGPADFELAENLVRDEAAKLAAADALHLACAINAKSALATFDVRLAEAARGRGVEVFGLD